MQGVFSTFFSLRDVFCILCDSGKNMKINDDFCCLFINYARWWYWHLLNSDNILPISSQHQPGSRVGVFWNTVYTCTLCLLVSYRALSLWIIPRFILLRYFWHRYTAHHHLWRITPLWLKYCRIAIPRKHRNKSDALIRETRLQSAIDINYGSACISR